jgi:hypothetical protein
VAYALGALAVVTAIVALVPLIRRTRRAGDRARALAPARVVAERAAASLSEIQGRAARDGWNDESLSSALSAARLIAATVIGRQISQKDLPADGRVPEGRLLVEYGFPRRTRATVSSAVTPAQVTRDETLRSALSLLTAALYRRAPDRDAVALDESVRQIIDASRGHR